MSFGPFETLPRFRAFGNSKFIASCPTAAHPRGDRNQSFSGKIEGQKILIHCMVGCTAKEILDAMSLGWDALFLDREYRPNTAKQLRNQAALEGFRNWRKTEFMKNATELRGRDSTILAADRAFELGLLTQEQFFEVLSGAYRGYSLLEHRFKILGLGTDAEALEVQRNG